MTRTVDLVVVYRGGTGIHAAIAAARRGERVLIVIGPGDRVGVGLVRRLVRSAGVQVHRRVTVVTGAELVCVDGVGRVEAVVVRHVGSGRLQAFNARAVAGE